MDSLRRTSYGDEAMAMTVEQYVILALIITVISNLPLSIKNSVDEGKTRETRWAVPFALSTVPSGASVIAFGVIGYPAAQGLISNPFFETLAKGGIVVAGLLLIIYTVWLIIYYLGKP